MLNFILIWIWIVNIKLNVNKLIYLFNGLGDIYCVKLKVKLNICI